MEASPGACLLGQVSTDVNDVVGDHAESDPAPDAVRSFIERSPQSMAAFLSQECNSASAGSGS